MTQPRFNSNTTAWRFQVWASFVLAFGATALGVAYLPVDLWTRGFIGMGVLFTVGSSFSLAKTLRDDYEASEEPTRTERAPGSPFRAAA